MKARVIQLKNPITTIFNSLETKEDILLDGDRVKFNYRLIKASPIFKRAVPKFKQFVLENKNKTFKVMYDGEVTNKHLLVSLLEDETTPRWLFDHSWLKRVTKQKSKKQLIL